MRTIWTSVLVFALLVFSGCFGGNDADSGGNGLRDPPQADLLVGQRVVYTDCLEHGGAFGVAPSEVAGRIPEGFVPVPFMSEVGGELITAVVISLACSLPDGSPAAEFYRILVVESPAAYRNEDASVHALVLDAVVTSEAAAAMYRDWGIEVALGEVALSPFGPAPPGTVGGYMQATGAGTTWHMYTGMSAQETTAPAGEGRLFFAAGGTVKGMADIVWSESTALMDGWAGLYPGAVPSPSGRMGFGWHHWGGEYGVTNAYVPLPGHGDGHEDAGA